MQVQDEIAAVNYQIELIPMNAEGGFYNWPSFFLPNLPFATTTDFDRYLTWLPGYADFIDYNIELMKHGIQEGVLAPKVIVQNNIELLEPWTSDSLQQHPFFQPVRRSGLSSGNRKVYQAKVLKVIEDDILPAYKRLVEFLANDYLEAAPEAIGISAISQWSGILRRSDSAFYDTRDDARLRLQHRTTGGGTH